MLLSPPLRMDITQPGAGLFQHRHASGREEKESTHAPAIRTCSCYAHMLLLLQHGAGQGAMRLGSREDAVIRLKGFGSDTYVQSEWARHMHWQHFDHVHKAQHCAQHKNLAQNHSLFSQRLSCDTNSLVFTWYAFSVLNSMATVRPSLS